MVLRRLGKNDQCSAQLGEFVEPRQLSRGDSDCGTRLQDLRADGRSTCDKLPSATLHIEPDQSHQFDRVALFDNAFSEVVIECHLAIFQLIRKVHIDGSRK